MYIWYSPFSFDGHLKPTCDGWGEFVMLFTPGLLLYYPAKVKISRPLIFCLVVKFHQDIAFLLFSSILNIYDQHYILKVSFLLCFQLSKRLLMMMKPAYKNSLILIVQSCINRTSSNNVQIYNLVQYPLFYQTSFLSNIFTGTNEFEITVQ